MLSRIISYQFITVIFSCLFLFSCSFSYPLQTQLMGAQQRVCNSRNQEIMELMLMAQVKWTFSRCLYNILSASNSCGSNYPSYI